MNYENHKKNDHGLDLDVATFHTNYVSHILGEVG